MKFIIKQVADGKTTGYVAPLYRIVGNKDEATVFDGGLDASLTAYALRKQTGKDYELKEIEDK